MAKATKKGEGRRQVAKKKSGGRKEAVPKAVKLRKAVKPAKKRGGIAAAVEAGTAVLRPVPPMALGASSGVLDRLWAVVESRRDVDPGVSHSARLLSRGTAKVAQKFGEEAVECLIEATLGNAEGVIGESADVLYHLLVMWVNAGIKPEQVWAELQRREGVSGITEKASRLRKLPMKLGITTSKIP